MADESHWIPISDLMAGVVAVMSLMFVVASLRNSISDVKVRVEKEVREEEGIRAALRSLQTDVQRSGVDTQMYVDVEREVILLRHGTFPSGSACLDETVASILAERGGRFRQLLDDNPSWNMLVEGHTDAVPFKRATTSPALCGPFVDNYSLSAARAREARRILLERWPEALTRRVGLAGWGPDQPLVDGTPEVPAAENRRVEIRFLRPDGP